MPQTRMPTAGTAGGIVAHGGKTRRPIRWEEGKTREMWKSIAKGLRAHPWASLSMAALLALVAWLFLPEGRTDERPVFETAPITRGDIRRIVSASGRLSAVRTVAVGSQVSGQIASIEVDFNSRVKAGQPIARIDPARFLAARRQAEAELEVAKANVRMAEAEIQRAEAALARERREMKRKERLLAQGHVSRAELDKQRLALRTAEAQLTTAQAQLATARAQVGQRSAQLEQIEVDLARTVIRSPIDGIVIERAVDPGQTVAASFQTPTLFRIAEDLTRMQVEAAVDEADIGQVAPDQPVAFTVDAWPDETFAGRVVQIRKAPRTEQNVVTYTVVVSAANPEHKLLPGMTATVGIVTGEAHDVLRAPLAARRFRPRPDLVAPASRDASSRRTDPRTGAGPRPGHEGRGRDLLWRIAPDGGHLVPVPVRFGIADDEWVEIRTPALSEGDEVVVAARNGPSRHAGGGGRARSRGGIRVRGGGR